MPEGKQFGSSTKVELGIQWVDDPEPPERRPAGYGWSMGQLTIRVAGVNVTATTQDGKQQPYVGWYLAPLLDWLATNWVALLHEEHLPWPDPRGMSAAIACNHALEEWTTADDPQGRRHYANAQDWYFRHGVRSAAAGGIFPDLFIRRVADDVELSWSGRPMAFTQDGLAFESGSGHARVAVGEVAEAAWQALDWAVSHPPDSPAEYHDHIKALRAKVALLRSMDYPTLARAYVHPAIFEKAEGAFAAIGRYLLEGGDSAPDAPYVAELPPAVAMFGGVSPGIGNRDVEYLRDQIVGAQGGHDSEELAELVADRHGSPLGLPGDAHRFAEELLEDIAPLAAGFVDVRAMCFRLGIDVQEVELETDSIRGVAIAGEGFSPKIVVNQTHYLNRNEPGKRLTVAHELCHVLFDRTRARRIAHASISRCAALGIERRANRFAAYLLMPRALVLEHLQDTSRIEKSDVQQAANRLRVSQSALLRHIQSLDLIDAVSRERLRDELAGSGEEHPSPTVGAKLMEVDLKKIVPISGGQTAAFEELCCQLARRTEEPRQFVRLHGAGGDGGIEGYVESDDGKRGWQAKYVFETSRLIKQASRSFRTALKIHPDLRSFVLCFPFDPTGKTARGKGGVEKLDEWRASELRYAKKIGRDIDVELWSASELHTQIIKCDHSGGMRRFFFDAQILTNRWFEDHLGQARETAGPRYTPELNVSTDLAKWFAAFGRTSVWSDTLSSHLKTLQEELSHLRVSDAETGRDEKTHQISLSHAWLGNSGQKVSTQALIIRRAVAALKHAKHVRREEYRALKASLQSSAGNLRSIEEELALEIDRRYGDGSADSPGWRQYMAEWMASLPAENLDATRGVLAALDALVEWLDSPECALAFETSFVLTGEAGSGKTHGVCDIAHRRYQEGLHTCLLFGHQFRNEPDPWTRTAETLGLTGLGRDQLLDAMDAAGEASGLPLLLCIDAINETKPLSYWRNRLMPLLHAADSRTFIRVCIVCRTSYAPVCLPEGANPLRVAHQGFDGLQRDACRTYCEHYGLRPPAMPLLQSEMRNPLYLRLVCETACSMGLQSLPLDWSGSVPTIEAFLREKERHFSERYEVPRQAGTMRETLTALVDHLVANAMTEVSWPTAVEVVLRRVAGLDRDRASRYVEWLVGEGLLIDDTTRGPYLDAGETLRLSFERLGDFLIADAILPANATGVPDLAPWVGTVADIQRHSGVLSVLSALLPERHGGSELPDMTEDAERSVALLALTMDALPSRSESAVTPRTTALVRRALGQPDLSFRTMGTLVSIAWRHSPIDVNWLHCLLRSIPLADRDAYWCAFLHESFTAEEVVAEIIDAAFELPLGDLAPAVAERWAKLLIWFTAAADRRVKDRATRAAVAVLSGTPTVLPRLIPEMVSIDDDAVRERTLLAAYGGLLRTRHLETLRSVSSVLHGCYTDDASAFSNALIRDQIRSICELAAHLGVLPTEVDPKFASGAREVDAWPLPLPSDEDVETWSNSILFWPDEFRSDFFKYSMWHMDRWTEGMCQEDMAKWMLQTIAQDLGFIGSQCEAYDHRMLHDHGGGRSKPVWAERIGKKYMWIAMYRLASRLHDNVPPKRDNTEPQPVREPLIAAQSRQLDPTLPPCRERAGRHPFFDALQFNTAGVQRDDAWIALEDDVPRIRELVEVQSVDGQNWRPLVAFLSSGRPEGDLADGGYRQIWLHLFGYLVCPSRAGLLLDKLCGRNFYGRWMPEGLHLGGEGGFVAEYPWATAFNTIPDEWYRHTGDDRLLELLPAWNDVSCEWEYDASLENASVCVPARLFFEDDDLWWDGQGGYSGSDGRTVFLDPSLGRRGPSTLLADAGHLRAKLQRMDRCVIWTLLGAKWMLGASLRQYERPSIKTFSQVAYVDTDGRLIESEMAFFDDPSQHTGLAE